MIPFNKPYSSDNEKEYLEEVIKINKYSGDGPYTKKCNLWLENNLHCKKALLTTSGTHALEMAALLCNIKPGDEVIMPSYTFTSTANAFVLYGAKIVFIDIRPDTMNIDESLIENAISDRTKVIVPVHYGGVACEMDVIMDIAFRYDLLVVEDAAQAILSTYKGKKLGTIGHLGCLSFHETKNIHCGEGGALLLNNEQFFDRAEIIREKGSNRSKFLRGQVDKYTWVDIGSSYLPSELNAAFLFAQLEKADEIINERLRIWNKYDHGLKELAVKGFIEIPSFSEKCFHNAHIFYIKCSDLDKRTHLIDYLKENNIQAVFHYIPLHASPAGLNFGEFFGKDIYTTKESERILRLPLWVGMNDELSSIINLIIKYFV